MQEFHEEISLYRQKVNSIIFQDLKKRKPYSLYKPLLYFLKTGGKRLRAILVLLSAKSIDSKLDDGNFNQAIAIELLHNFTLIHDDIMDNSKKRHNKPTLHEKYDISTAILCGDALLALAYEYLTRELNVNYDKIVMEFNEALRIVCEGQALDKEFESRKNVSIREYELMISQKTGALIKAACRIGASLKTDDYHVISKLGEFGELLGKAFQIQDDILDVIGDEKKFGKKIGSDLIEGKKTFLLLTSLNLAKGKELKELSKLIENKGIKSSHIKKYIDIYKKIGVIDYTRDEISKYNEKILNLLDELSESIDTRDLRRFHSLVMERES